MSAIRFHRIVQCSEKAFMPFSSHNVYTYVYSGKNDLKSFLFEMVYGAFLRLYCEIISGGVRNLI